MNTPEHPDHISVTSGMSGYFAVHVSWNTEDECWEPYNTGLGRYKTYKEAADEGKRWAVDEGIEYKGRDL
jgi:hypothetical protein